MGYGHVLENILLVFYFADLVNNWEKNQSRLHVHINVVQASSLLGVRKILLFSVGKVIYLAH